MRTLIRIIILLLILIIAYNYFLGDTEEKESTETVISNAKELIHSIGTVIKSEKEKYHDGKYDDAINKLGNLFDKVKESITSSTRSSKDRLKELEKQKLEIEEEYHKLKNEPDSVREVKKEQLNIRLEEIISETEEILEKEN